MQTMQTQLAVDGQRRTPRTPRTLGLGIDLHDRRHQILPWYSAIHFVEESLNAGGFAILLE